MINDFLKEIRTGYFSNGNHVFSYFVKTALYTCLAVTMNSLQYIREVAVVYFTVKLLHRVVFVGP